MTLAIRLLAIAPLLCGAAAHATELRGHAGHDDIEHAQLYSREAPQVRLAVKGMDRIVSMVGKNRRG